MEKAKRSCADPKKSKGGHVRPSAKREYNAITKNGVSFDPRDGELVCSSCGEDLISDDVSSVQGSIILPCPLEIAIEDSCSQNTTKNATSSEKAIFWNASVRFAKTGQHDGENRTFDLGGPAFTTKVASSGVLCCAWA